MKIAIDFDDTYTRDPSMWNQFILNMIDCGHEVFCVTWRHEDELSDVEDTIGTIIDSDKIIATGRLAKDEFCRSKDIFIDVWIDDDPCSITRSMEPYSQRDTQGRKLSNDFEIPKAKI